MLLLTKGQGHPPGLSAAQHMQSLQRQGLPGSSRWFPAPAMTYDNNNKSPFYNKRQQ